MADRTPAEWRAFLERKLHDRWASWQIFDDYYEGDSRIGAWLRTIQTAFQGTPLGNLLAGLNDNYMTLVVDAPAERLRVNGFRFGDKDADKDAERIWQANGLDGESNMLHTEAIKLGEASWLVQPNGDEPIITAEHPSQFIVATAPGNRRKRLAAFKKWVEDDSTLRCNVYLPDRIVKYAARRDPLAVEKVEWETIAAASNSLGEVPAVPAPNNPSMLKGGRSDLAYGAIALQDQILKTVADSLIGAEYQGLPQRVLLGVEPPRDPDTGRPIPFEQAAKSRLWYFNNPNAKAHEFSQADLKNLRETVDGFIGDLAAQTRIPIYYFRPQAISNISAEALIGLDAGLVSKVNDKKAPFGEAHEEAMRLAFKSIDPNDPRASYTQAETVWADTESRSQAQVVDAATKKQTLGVPFGQIMEDVGYTPEQITRMETERAADVLLNDAAEPAVPPAH